MDKRNKNIIRFSINILGIRIAEIRDYSQFSAIFLTIFQLFCQKWKIHACKVVGGIVK